MMVLSRIHILYLPYQDINTSPCDYSGISKPVEKLPCKYVLSRLTSSLLRQAFITRAPLFSFRSFPLAIFTKHSSNVALLLAGTHRFARLYSGSHFLRQVSSHRDQLLGPLSRSAGHKKASLQSAFDGVFDYRP